MGLMNRTNVSDLRGVVKLAVDATVGITDLVEKVHHTIQLGHPPLGTSHANKTKGLTGFVYRSIRGTTHLLGRGLDAGLVPVAGLLPETASPAIRDAVVSAINGVSGDHLVQTGNPLAIEMTIRQAGAPLDIEEPDAVNTLASSTGKLMLFVHGLCLNDGHWSRDGQNRGETLAAELGYTPLYLRYNTGLPIASNGRQLAMMLQEIMHNWPCPVNELAIVGHSMGGLVARSACHYAQLESQDWLHQLRSLVFIGTPHQGAPLERSGNWIEKVMGLSPYAAPFTRITKKRSAGMTDLRHGSITDQLQVHVPLPGGVDSYAMAATLGNKRSRIHERLIGDGLVSVDSALGKAKDPSCCLAIPDNRQWIGFETGHIELLGHPGVYTQLHHWLQ